MNYLFATPLAWCPMPSAAEPEPTLDKLGQDNTASQVVAMRQQVAVLPLALRQSFEVKP